MVKSNFFKKLWDIMFGPIFQGDTSFRVSKQGRFVAKDHFKKVFDDNATVKISLLTDFESFIDKVDDPVKETVLAVRTLVQNVWNKEIVSKIVSEEFEITLSQLWSILEKQGQSQKGILLTNGFSNIFFIRNSQDVLCVISVRKHNYLKGWCITVQPIDNWRGWLAGNQIIFSI